MGGAERRVVITGMGMITPLGLTVEENWQNILACKSGIGKLTKFSIPDYPVTIAGEVKGFDPADFIERREIKKMDRFVQFAVAAAQEAMTDSGLDANQADANRIGVIIGSGYGGIVTVEENSLKAHSGRHNRISPFYIPSAIINMASGQVAIKYGLRGPSYAVVSACSTGLHAIADGCFAIQRGDADAMIVGGSEATLSPSGIAGFANAKALSFRNHEPEKASRPFDADRDGFVCSEGVGVLILEEREYARRRGAHARAEVIGVGMSTDAFHMTAPDPEGRGPAICMQNALRNAGLEPEQVDYVNAHGTSTQLNDAAETKALKRAFGDHAYRIPISSTKSQTGHLLGAAGAIEAIYCALAIQHQVIPATINYDTPDPNCDLDYVPNEPRQAKVDVTLSNSFGFGGTNVSLALRTA